MVLQAEAATDLTRAVSGAPSGRTIGVVYLLYMVVGIAAGLLMRGVEVPGDAAATASHLLASGTRFRIGVEADLLSNILYIALTALFYRLFRPVAPNRSLIMAFVSLAGCVVQIAGELSRFAASYLLHDASMAAAFSPAQLHAAASMSLALYTRSYHLSLPLFGGFDMLLGAAILKSNFVPRSIGIAMVAAGVGCLTFLWPPLATALRWIVFPVGGVAEVALMLWLLLKGANRSN